jgi:hypothetical protein
VKPLLLALCMTLPLGALAAPAAHADIIIDDDEAPSDPPVPLTKTEPAEPAAKSESTPEEAKSESAPAANSAAKSESAPAKSASEESEGLCSLARTGSPLAGALYACLGLLALFTARGLARRGR